MKKNYIYLANFFLLISFIQNYASKEEILIRRNGYAETEPHQFDTESELHHLDSTEFKKEPQKKTIAQESQEDDVLREHQENFIRAQLNRLPEEKRPVISLALQNMKEGQEAFDAIEKGKFFDAIQVELVGSDKTFADEFSGTVDLLAQVFNSSDEDFWTILEHDLKNKNSFLEKMAEKFNLEDVLVKTLFLSPEYNMYFRLEYLRLKFDKYAKKDAFFQRLEKVYLKILVKLQWYFYKESILQGKVFTSGMITFKDTIDRCFKFLEGYIELVSPGYRDKGSFMSLLQPKGYLRISSHYKGQTALDGKNYGIDLNDIVKNQIGLPAGKGHILFGMRSNGMTFVKWEDFGTTFNPLEGEYSVVPHMYNFLHKNGKSDNHMEFREADMKGMKEKFQLIYGKNLSEADKELVKVEGIAGMQKILDQLPEATQLEKIDKAQKLEAFEKAFAYYFSHDDLKTIAHRKGSEVVLDFGKDR